MSSPDRISVLHVAPIHWKTHTGINVAVPASISAQARDPRADVALLTTEHDAKMPSATDYPVYKWARRFNLDALPSPFSRPDLIVFHSTYIGPYLGLARDARRRGIPYVIVPHGGLTDLAQRSKWWKKKPANISFYRSYFTGAAAFHYLTPNERDRSLVFRRPSVVVGNGVDLPPLPLPCRPTNQSALRIVFLGRLTVYIKGLDLLLEALALIKPHLTEHNVCVSIYGPDEDRGRATLLDLVADRDLNEFVEICPPVSGEQKAKVLRECDVFVHTSRTEGHPMAVLEALSYGAPCILTPGTNMAHEVSAAGAGWCVRGNALSIAEGIEQVLREKHQLDNYSRRARLLVEERYQWESIAATTLQHYIAIVGGRG